MNTFNRSIKCSVHDCIFHQKKLNYCTLQQIKIAVCTAEENKESTMCDNYECKKKRNL